MVMDGNVLVGIINGDDNNDGDVYDNDDEEGGDQWHDER